MGGMEERIAEKTPKKISNDIKGAKETSRAKKKLTTNQEESIEHSLLGK